MFKKRLKQAMEEEIIQAENKRSYDADSHYSDELNGYIRGLHKALEIVRREGRPFWRR